MDYRARVSIKTPHQPGNRHSAAASGSGLASEITRISPTSSDKQDVPFLPFVDVETLPVPSVSSCSLLLRCCTMLRGSLDASVSTAVSRQNEQVNYVPDNVGSRRLSATEQTQIYRKWIGTLKSQLTGKTC
jgi:hypothetical protein